MATRLVRAGVKNGSQNFSGILPRQSSDDDHDSGDAHDLFVQVTSPEKHTTAMESYITFRVFTRVSVTLARCYLFVHINLVMLWFRILKIWNSSVHFLRKTKVRYDVVFIGNRQCLTHLKPSSIRRGTLGPKSWEISLIIMHLTVSVTLTQC